MLKPFNFFDMVYTNWLILEIKKTNKFKEKELIFTKLKIYLKDKNFDCFKKYKKNIDEKINIIKKILVKNRCKILKDLFKKK